jgi:hypothetical protein
MQHDDMIRSDDRSEDWARLDPELGPEVGRDLDYFEKLGFAIMVIFGVVVIAGLMAVGIAWQNKPAFLFALASAVTVWFSSFAVAFDQPRTFIVLVGIAVALVAGSITTIVI